MGASEFEKLAGLKHREFQPCVVCGKGMMHGGDVQFYRLTLQGFLIMVQEVRRAAGLEQMLDGHAALANTMGPDADLAKAPLPPQIFLLCQPCALGPDGIGYILSALQTREEGNDDGETG